MTVTSGFHSNCAMVHSNVGSRGHPRPCRTISAASRRGLAMRMLRTTSDGSSQIQTPQHLMERVRGSRDGERKTITVLFADIASSTALIDDRDAEDARQILKPTIDAMIDIVRHYGGVTREEGDGIMASFGAPIALEDHALRACYAALDMQEIGRAHV